VKKIWLASNFTICLSLLGCQEAAKNYPVGFVDRKAVFPSGNLTQMPNTLMLVIGITEDGRLSLNKIETGTIADISLLSEKLKVIFEDREKASIKEREVVIDPQGKVRKEDLEKLIETLASIKASPIWIVKNNL
jgi:hypothetical protein